MQKVRGWSNVFTSKRQHFCLQRQGGVAENTAHFTPIMFCHYVMLSCQRAKRDEEDNGGLLSCGRACDELIKASLSKCRFVAVITQAAVVCLYSVVGCLVFVCVPLCSYGLLLCSRLADWHPAFSAAHVNARTHQ